MGLAHRVYMKICRFWVYYFRHGSVYKWTISYLGSLAEIKTSMLPFFLKIINHFTLKKNLGPIFPRKNKREYVFRFQRQQIFLLHSGYWTLSAGVGWDCQYYFSGGNSQGKSLSFFLSFLCWLALSWLEFRKSKENINCFGDRNHM